MSARTAAVTSGSEKMAGRSRLTSNRRFASGRRPGRLRPREARFSHTSANRSSRFPTIADAWTFLTDATITTAATVTIQLAPERYDLKAPLRLDRADSGRIEAEQCKVETASRRGVGTVFQSHLNGTMELVRCTAVKSKRDDNWSAGFVAGTGGYLGCESCEASGWDHGFLAHLSSFLWLTRCTSKDNDSGLTAALGSSATADDCEFTGDADWAMKAANRGSMLIRGCTLSKSACGCCAMSNSDVLFASRPSQISGCTAAAFQSRGGGTFDGLKPTLTDDRGEFNLLPATTPTDQVFFWE